MFVNKFLSYKIKGFLLELNPPLIINSISHFVPLSPRDFLPYNTIFARKRVRLNELRTKTTRPIVLKKSQGVG